ncbi:uncharacterized protein B0I36DRAFT_245210 [Microdochium trichocladiopsis]|uniref:Rhodopsin domain-containing protein n=1 Tax=Microdochium trichocladiopsis TaxID=1682393 RepID=A0A9P8Y2Z8_9PEZI|nr:uncharacterized protein B0I36DRAFT_245210 [Microdochium trichocladiopsis]KAH7028756.1 hypothetical protein B0I36DRAFT_245210 [Microdochium trichocladiopsis]
MDRPYTDCLCDEPKQQIIEWCIVGVCIAILVVRLMVRARLRQWSFWLSDVLLGIGVLSFVVLSASNTYALMTGLDYFDHVYEERLAKAMLQVLFMDIVVFDTGYYWPRLSLLAFYNELFPVSEHKLRICLYIISVYTVCAFLSAVFIDLFWCGPDISVNWCVAPSCNVQTRAIPFYTNWAVGFSSELLVFALPFGMMNRLRSLGRREKAGLYCIFMLGLVTIFTGTARLIMAVHSIYSYATCKSPIVGLHPLPNRQSLISSSRCLLCRMGYPDPRRDIARTTAFASEFQADA